MTEAPEKGVAKQANHFFEGIDAAMRQARERMSERQKSSEQEQGKERGERER